VSILRCNIVVNEVGVKQFIPFAIEDDIKALLINDSVVAFNVFPAGDKIDMRNKPPFHSIIPCPHCGTENDRKHDASKHTDTRLGTPEEQVKALAQEIAKEFGIEDRWGDLTVLAANEFLEKKLDHTSAKSRAEKVKEVLATRAKHAAMYPARTVPSQMRRS